jgi:hypothetical protein
MSGSYKIIWMGDVKLEYKVAITGNSIDNRYRQEIDFYWDEYVKTNPAAFNGRILNLADYSVEGDHLLVRSSFIEYKVFYASRYIQALREKIRPLGVSGLIIVNEKDEKMIVLGKRSNSVTQYPGWLELVPSGSIDDTYLSGKTIDIKRSLLKELEEEANITGDMVSPITTFTFVMDEDEQTYDICCMINVQNGEEIRSRLENNSEYESYLFLPLAAIEDISEMSNLIPTSKAILSAFMRIKKMSC